MGILLRGYPEDGLLNDQMRAIQEVILQKNANLEEVSVKPKFLSSTHKAGYMVLNCVDKATAKWLLDNAGIFLPWESAKLKARRKQGTERRYYPHLRSRSRQEKRSRSLVSTETVHL